MAELCPGDTYSLSSKKNCNDEIEYIFVKLTDSAYRALQEYQRNQSRISATPAIQLQENGGHLSIPSAQQSFNSSSSRGTGSSPSSNNGGGQQQQQVTFSFTLSSNSDIEGPQGSFECVQKREDRLDSLGALARKMRIHANEDVYEATRHRMAVAEENQKNKCTREIKPDQTDIGRKVKVKQIPQLPSRNAGSGNKPIIHPLQQPMGNGNTNLSSNNNRHRSQPSTSPPPILSGVAGAHCRPAPLGVSQQSQGVADNNAARIGRPPPPPQPPRPPPNSGGAGGGAKSDVMRRPIKERLIHLLALRPFKKPELYSRVNQEGIREREKNCIATVLKQISTMRDNTYHLRRHIWNDVHDDWPFYTIDERALMKRRKPQNLTPPTSSDGGSSGSGQSPSSTHAGSPPQAISSGKRQAPVNAGYDMSAWENGVAPKKQRISHFRKPNENSGSVYNNRPSPPETNGGNKMPVTENGYRRNVTDSRESSNMNPRSREDIRNNSINTSNFITNGSNGYSSTTNSNGSNDYTNGMACEDENIEPLANNNSTNHVSRNNNSKKPIQHYSDTSNNSLSFGVVRDPKTMGLGYDRNVENNIGGLSNGSLNAYNERVINKTEDKKRNKLVKTSSPSSHNNTPAVKSPIGQLDRLNEAQTPNIEVMAANVTQQPVRETQKVRSQETNDVEPPQYDFSSEYTRIQSIEQRRKYKREFDDNYEEYRELHNAVDQVSQRFVALEERLRSVQQDSQEYKDIKRQIVTEYNQHLQDSRHTTKLTRYQYLHHKLSHIKRLVVEYDNEIKCKSVIKN